MGHIISDQALNGKLKMRIAYKFFILLTLIFLNKAEAYEEESQVILLIDFSTSYFEKSRMNKLQKNFEYFGELLISEDANSEAPIIVDVRPIGVDSAQGESLCTFTVARKGSIKKNIGCDGGKTGPLCTSKKEAIKDFFSRTCFNKIASIPAAKFTDISGALYTASRIKLGGPKPYLVIFSDMEESRGDLPLGKIDLEGFKVLVVCSNKRVSNTLCDEVAPGFWFPKFAEMGVNASNINIVNEGVTGGWHRHQRAIWLFE